MVRRAIAGALLFALSVGIVPLARHFMSSTPEWLWRVAAIGAGLGVVTAAGLVPFYPWLSNPTEHRFGSTVFITLSAAAIAALCWLLFALKIGAPDFIVSVFRGYYEPATQTLSVDVAYINRSPVQRTVLGASFTFHERGNRTHGAMLGNSIFGDVNTVHIEPEKTETVHYTQNTDLRQFNAMALAPSGKTKGEVEAGLQIASLNPEGIQQLKSVYFMSLNVDEGICQFGMFQGQKASLNVAGDVFIK